MVVDLIVGRVLAVCVECIICLGSSVHIFFQHPLVGDVQAITVDMVQGWTREVKRIFGRASHKEFLVG